MREILFRGKRIDNGEWVYGSFVDESRREMAWILGAQAAYPDYGQGSWPYSFRVHPETVGQFIGAYDTDGERIFEDDVLLIRSTMDGREFRVPVIFVDGMFEAKGSGLICHNPDRRVIGNRRDNPELLEAQA